MQFTPKTEKEITEAGLWPAGKYQFEVIPYVDFGNVQFSTQDSISKKTNKEMIILVLKIYNSEGAFKIVVDYLVEAMAYKLRHAAEALNLLDKYNTGNLHALDFVEKRGELELSIQKADDKYAAKNIVKDYVVSEVTSQEVGVFDSSVPPIESLPWE